MPPPFRRLLRSGRGVAAIDYTLIVALIAMTAINAMAAVAGKMTGVFASATNAMT